MAVDDVYILALRAQLNGKQVVNTFAFRRKSAPEPDNIDWNGLAVSLLGNIKAYQVDDLVYQDWRATKVRGSGVTYSTTPPFRVSTVSYSGPFNPAQAGALTSTPLPNSVALVVSLSTAQSGRRRRGRVFIGGIPEVFVDDDSTFNATQLATIQGSMNTIVSNWGAGSSDANWEWGVWSDRIATNTAYSNTWPRVLTSQGAPDPANAYLVVAGATARDFVGSQRDRRPGL